MVIEFSILKEYIYAISKGLVNENQTNRLCRVPAEVLLKMQHIRVNGRSLSEMRFTVLKHYIRKQI